MSIPASKTDVELDEAALVDAVRTFVAVQARDWQRRQLNAIFPAVQKEVMLAQAKGHAIDVPAVLKKVWLNRDLPRLG